MRLRFLSFALLHFRSLKSVSHPATPALEKDIVGLLDAERKRVEETVDVEEGEVSVQDTVDALDDSDLFEQFEKS